MNSCPSFFTLERLAQEVSAAIAVALLRVVLEVIAVLMTALRMFKAELAAEVEICEGTETMDCRVCTMELLLIA
jgi:mevalonate kinase